LSEIIYAQPPTISYQSTITGLSNPLAVVNAGDGSNRLFIVEQGGLIKVWDGNSTSPFINLGATGANIITYNGERGLLGLAFHPNFDGVNNRYFYVYYADLNSDITISRFQTMAGNSNIGDPSTGQVIITIPHPGFTNHYGGTLIFGPDGYLYFATGDGGSANDPNNNAQNGNSLLGKVIRIDVNNTDPPTYPMYAVPADNPYVSDPAVDDRIWALGLRNPFRWSFDRANGNMWIGDVGQGAKEEVDFRPAGSTGHVNYGWHCYEGTIPTPFLDPPCAAPPPDNVFPIFDYDNPNGPNPPSSAVTGGYVYRGTEYAGFIGYYIATDYYSGTVYLIWPNGSGWSSAAQTGLQNGIAGFGEAENGDLYAASQATGTVYKVAATGGTPLPVLLTSFSVKHFLKYNELTWSTGFEQGTSRFHIEFGTDGNNFSRAGSIAASRNSNGSNYSFQHKIMMTTNLYYRLGIEDDNGSIRYSSILKVAFAAIDSIGVYPSLIRGGILNLTLSGPANKLQLFNSQGQLVYQKELEPISGTLIINLPPLPGGLYFLQVLGREKETAKVIIE
jgi:glucose/arabinose dehydrogenase